MWYSVFKRNLDFNMKKIVIEVIEMDLLETKGKDRKTSSFQFSHELNGCYVIGLAQN